jgi:hypothetical protein
MRWEHLSQGTSRGFETIKLMVETNSGSEVACKQTTTQRVWYGTNWAKKSSKHQKAM